MAPRDKRKRGDARYSYDDDQPNRQSPHRPQNLPLAQGYQHQQHQTNSPRGGSQRRGSRNSGRGGHNGPQSPTVAPSPTSMAPPVNAHQASKPAQSNPAPTPTPSTPTLSKEVKEQAPEKKGPPPEVPDMNNYLTAKRVRNWNEEQRNAVVQTAIALQRDCDMLELSGLFYEINEACIKGYMKPSDLGPMVRDILSAPCSDPDIEPTQLFLDSITTAGYLDGEDAAKKKLPFRSIRQMLVASEIDPYKLRCSLDDTMLIGLELVRPSFAKMGVRKATNALYRQMNYNLLREESEGFSKLMTEYFNTVNTEDPTREAVSAAYERVNAYIGAFDLDVGRVLDVTLDVFANLIVKHCKFFVKYLRASSWWPELEGIEGLEWEEPEVQTLPRWALPDAPSCEYSEEELQEQLQLRERRDIKFWGRVAELGERDGIKAFFELGARRVTSNSRRTEDASKPSPQTPTKKWAEDWIATTGTVPPSGNDIAAQLLGFKLRFYASDARDATDVLPDNLIYLAALLIKIGFISITDLYPHLYPADADMAAHKEKLMNEKKQKEAARNGKAANALTKAGALSDDTLPAPAVTRLREAESKASSRVESEGSTPAKSEEETRKSNLPDPVDQKVALLRNLLLIGAIPEAMFILGRYPWLLDVYPDLHTYIFRLAHHSLHKVYESSRPVPLDKIPSGPKGANALLNASSFPPRRSLRWPKLEQKDAGDGHDYRFYWDDCMDNVPVCQTVDDVFLLCSSLLSLVGPECGRDILLMTKLARIGKKSVTEDPSGENVKRWSDLSSTFLAPALTFTGQNPGVVNEMWELFKRFDTATRYAMYAHWFGLMKPAVMRTAFKDVQDNTKHLLGRVAATNTRPMGRAMAKLAYACPGTVFQQTLRQGQSYINMIDALVECSRYLTNLGYDCLTWTLVNTLVSNDRSTLQGDGMLVKGWLKNTAIFIGKVYRRYSLMDPTPVLQFVQHQLVRPEGEMYMLTVLEQLISTMGGIGLSGALTESRVLALSAGPKLRAFTLEHHLGDERHLAKSPARRLLRCLKESHLMQQILIALAQQVENYLHREELLQVPDKVVFTNFDHFRSNFAQYLEFLRDNVSTEEFDEHVPGVVELISEYGLEASLAFQICRESLAVHFGSARTKLGSAEHTPTGDVEMGGTEAKASTNGADIAEDVEMKDDAMAQPVNSNNTTANGHSVDQGSPSESNSEISTIAQQLRAKVPKYGEHMFVDFFVTFWSLSFKDIFDPAGDELKIQYEDAKKYINSKSTARDAEGRYPHASVVRHAKQEMEELGEEHQETLRGARLAQSGLQKEMMQWFPQDINSERSQVLHDEVLQDCFLPRVRLSVQDAQFASTMLFFMHRTGVPGFRLLKFLDRLFITERLSPIICSMSEEEVKCFGRFLKNILSELLRWHQNEKIFNKSAHGEDKQLRGFAMSGAAEAPLMTYEQFRILHYKWHDMLFKTLKESLETKQYTEMRNSIFVLKDVSPAFPKIDGMAVELRTQIEGIAQEDERDDIKVAANSILADFKRGAKLWKTKAAFRGEKEPPKEAAKPAAAAATPNASAARPTNAGAAKLSAAAPAFSPKPPETNGLSKPVPGQGPRASQEQRSSDDRKPSVASGNANSTPRVNGRDANTTKPVPPGPVQSNVAPRDAPRGTGLSQTSASPVPNRPESRSSLQASANSRAPQHTLPTRPDPQPPRPRQTLERPGDRPTESYANHGRLDGRPTTPNDYGRSGRTDGSLRDRDATVRRPRSRSPAVDPAEYDQRERTPRDGRGYNERGEYRAPPRDSRVDPLRDSRGPPTRGAYGESPRDPRDPREPPREYRDRGYDMSERGPPRGDSRVDPRGPAYHTLPPPSDGRSRLHHSPRLTNTELPPRRELPGSTQHEDRNSGLPPRPSVAATSGPNQVPINPARAALIHDDRVRDEPSRSGRDGRRDESDTRRDHAPRHQSPRRDDRPLAAAAYTGADTRRDYRDSRDTRGPLASSSRGDRREDAGPPPTGPRSGRDAQPPPSVSREMFQPTSSAPARPRQTQDPNYGRLNQTQDSNYGRLNQPESVPSGPRNPVSDRRDSQARQPAAVRQPPTPTSTAAPITPTAPAAQAPGIHPSRLNNISRGPPGPSGPPLQTAGLNAPVGPRSGNRATPTGPAGRTPFSDINRTLNAASNANANASPTTDRPDRRSGRERTPDRRSDGRGEGRGGAEMRGENRGEGRGNTEMRGDGRGEERSSREKRDRDGSRRERGDHRGDRERKDVREGGRDDRDRRSRGGERGDEGRERGERKRGRDPNEVHPSHGEVKRRH